MQIKSDHPPCQQLLFPTLLFRTVRSVWRCCARARMGHVAHHIALVRHIALNLIRLNTSVKTTIKIKSSLAATSDEFWTTLLGLEIDEEDDD